MSLRSPMRFAVVAAFVMTAFAGAAQTPCPQKEVCSKHHHFSMNSEYPYTENFVEPVAPSTSTVLTNSWQKIAYGCDALGYVNVYAGSQSFNALARAFVRFDKPAPAFGTLYEVDLKIDGLSVGRFERAVTAAPDTHFFNTIAANLSPGQHTFEMWARVITPGQSIQLVQQMLTLQGVPVAYQAKKDLIPYSSPHITVTGWQQVSNTLEFFTPAGENVDLFLQGYLQLESGTAGDQIAVGFSLQKAGSLSGSTEHTSEFYPAVYRQGVNVVDHINNIPAGGPHKVSLWVISRSGRPITISKRQLDLFTMKVGKVLGTNPNGSEPMMAYTYQTTPVTVTPIGSAVQPYLPNYSDCGKWTLIDEFTMSYPANGPFMWMGDGYVELLSRDTNSGWSTSDTIELVMEIYTDDGTGKPTKDGAGNNIVAEFRHFNTTMPASGKKELYYTLDAGHWGNNPMNRVKVWMRKVTVGACPNGGGLGSFTVGKRYIAVKMVPAGSLTCYY